MANATSLTVIVPGSALELANGAAAQATLQLGHLAARGSLRYAWDRRDLQHGSLHAWQRGLLWALQLPEGEHPSAVITALGNGLVGNELAVAADWLHAQPVHLAASLSHLSLVELSGDLQLAPAFAATFADALRAHLQSSGLRLHVPSGGDWLIEMPATLQVATCCPAVAAANDLELAMPQGSDARGLRRLMTELQMLLHEHPLNQQRVAQGLPAANSLWLWGNGACGGGGRALPVAFGSHDYLRGLYRLHQGNLQPLPRDVAQLLLALAAVPQAVVLLEAQPVPQFEQQWLVPLVQALRTRRLARLDLVLDSWHLSIDRRGLRRFWRRPLPPGSWVA